MGYSPDGIKLDARNWGLEMNLGCVSHLDPGQSLPPLCAPVASSVKGRVATEFTLYWL